MGFGIAAADRVSLGENSRMMIGGAHNANGIMVEFVQGIADIGAGEGDATTNLSGGYEVPTRGPRRCRVNGDCLWKSASNPLSNPPGLKPGDLIGRVIIWPDFDNAPGVYIKMPSCQCLGFTITMVGTADVRFSFAGRNDGKFWHPADLDPAGVLA